MRKRNAFGEAPNAAPEAGALPLQTKLRLDGVSPYRLNCGA